MDLLKDINFVFGTNGAGKTTIGRVVGNKTKYPDCAISWRDGLEMQPLVYNRDFVDANFSAEGNLKGIFTLGEKDIANELAIAAKKAEVDRYDDEIAQRKHTLGDPGLKLGKVGEIADLEADCKERCWTQKRKHDDAFSEAFFGVRGDAAKFKERELQQGQLNTAESQTFEYLSERARTVFGPTPQRQTPVPSLAYTRIVALEADPILSKKVVGKDDVDIAEMIHSLGHSDWVKSGQSLYKQSAPDSVLPATRPRRVHGES